MAGGIQGHEIQAYTHPILLDDLLPQSHIRDNEARMTATPAGTRDAVGDHSQWIASLP
jgi:hypothetical protein